MFSLEIEMPQSLGTSLAVIEYPHLGKDHDQFQYHRFLWAN